MSAQNLSHALPRHHLHSGHADQPHRPIRDGAERSLGNIVRGTLLLALALFMAGQARSQGFAQYPSPVQGAGMTLAARSPAQPVTGVPPASTQTPSPPAGAAVTAPIEKALRIYLDAETTGLPGRVEVTVSPLDERLNLAPCTALEPYLPAGTRLWGRTHLGVRCKSGAGWNVLLPVQVRVFGPALVASRMIPSGQAPTADDFRLEEIDLTRESGVVLNDPAQMTEQVLARPLSAGQVLRKDHLRPRPVLASGDPVRLVYIGPGFSVSGQGKALAPAAEGQVVRVQLESGRILAGIARAGRTVEITP